MPFCFSLTYDLSKHLLLWQTYISELYIGGFRRRPIVEDGGQRVQEGGEFLLHAEAHQVFPRDDADDAVVGVNHGEMSQTQSPEDDVCPVEGEIVWNAGCRLVDIRHL